MLFTDPHPVTPVDIHVGPPPVIDQPLVMTWVGGNANNDIYDVPNWSPTGPIDAADTLYLLDGTADMAGGNLNGATLTMGFTDTQLSTAPENYLPTLNLSDNADLTLQVGGQWGVHDDATINVSGADTIALSGGIPLSGPVPSGTNVQINLAAGSTLTASGATFYEGTTISGSGDFDPNNMAFAEGSLNILSDMIGTSNVNMAMIQGEIGGSVAAGVSITLQVADQLTIDHPDQFQGTIISPSNAMGPNDAGLPDEQVTLQGIQADSYDLINDILTLYKGNSVVDTMKFNDQADSTFVGQGASGVVIGMNVALPSGVTALAQHSPVVISM